MQSNDEAVMKDTKENVNEEKQGWE